VTWCLSGKAFLARTNTVIKLSRFWITTVLQLSVVLPVAAQESTVYASVISTKLFIVGAPNPQTGLFFQQASDDTAWQHTGAKNIRGNCVAFYPPAKGQIIYIASGNGLHKTTDGGKSWRITTGWEITEVFSLGVDTRNAANMFIGTAYGVYKSTDGCATWKQVHRGFISSVIVDHSNSNVLYCSTEDGVFKSVDAGETWARSGLSIKRTRVIVQHPKNAGILFVGTEDNGIYVTENGGTSWTKIEAGIDHATFFTIAFDPGNPDLMYAGGYVTGVYKSVNGGKNWKRSSRGFLIDNIHSICVDPLKNDRIYAATIGDGVYRSDDGGISWHNIGLKGSQVWTITVRPN
jgi:photosystem II stability/assembly factor-like uncharacterized protein